jgi:hypothetical protein
VLYLGPYLLCLTGCLPGLSPTQGGIPARSSPDDVPTNHVVFVADPHPQASLAQDLARRYQLGKSEVLELVIGPPTPIVFPAMHEGERSSTVSDIESWVQESSCLDLARSADTLILRGGSFMDWFELSSPKEYRSYLPQVLRGHAKSKKNIIVLGGGCAFLSGGVLVPRDRLTRSQRNPRLPKDAPEARVNLSLGPGMMYGSDSWTDSSPLRLLRSMHENQIKLGAFFVGQVAMDYDRGAQTLTVLGPGHLILIDLTRARIFPQGVRQGRISSLGQGDHWKVGSAPICLAAGKEHGTPDWQTKNDHLTWEADPGGAELVRWFEELRPSQVERQSPHANWALGWDERSQRQIQADPEGHRSWLNLPFDCSWPKGH